MSDYLAIIYIGGGSSHGRSSDKEKAITNALKHLRNWRSLFQVSDIDVEVNVVDVEGYSDVSWGVDGLQGLDQTAPNKWEKIDRPFEHLTRRTPRIRWV